MNIRRTLVSLLSTIVVTLTMLGIVLINAQTSDEEPDLSYRTLDYDVAVQRNGDLKVTQHIDMRLKDRGRDWKQMYQRYTLKSKNLTDISDIGVKDVSNGETYRQGDFVFPDNADNWNDEHAGRWYIVDVTEDENDPQPFNPQTDGLSDDGQADKTLEIGWNIPQTVSEDSLKFDVSMTLHGVSTANDNVSFTIEQGELAIILGASGAGKSTVLNILGGMDANTSGQVIIDGKDISNYTPKQLTAYRRTDIGFVFQFYNLVANLTARENVELASQIVPDAQDARQALADVGLADRVDNFPAQLSGGEQQRVAIARAVAKNPKILLCDEPTGALDYNTGKQVLRILQDMSRKKGATVVIVTHNSAIAPIADRVIRMHDGRVSSIEVNEHPMDIEELEW